MTVIEAHYSIGGNMYYHAAKSFEIFDLDQSFTVYDRQWKVLGDDYLSHLRLVGRYKAMSAILKYSTLRLAGLIPNSSANPSGKSTTVYSAASMREVGAGIEDTSGYQGCDWPTGTCGMQEPREIDALILVANKKVRLPPH